MVRARVVGVGHFLPSRVVSTDRIAAAIPGWSAERILERTGIRERRFLWDFDEKKGVAIPPPEGESLYPISSCDMSEVALERALGSAGLDASDLDALFVVTCTPDELNFSHDAMELHRRFNMRKDAFAMVIDDGCGGTPYLIDLVRKMIEAGAMKTVAVVASAFTSPLVNREVFTAEIEPSPGEKALSGILSMYVFGDAAGAMILRGDSGGRHGIVSSFSANSHEELVLRRGGGSMRHCHQGRAGGAQMAFVVHGQKVALSYPRVMEECIATVTDQMQLMRGDVDRYYLHQPNKRLLDLLIKHSELDPSKVAVNVDRYGNSSAAGMLVLLSEDLIAGKVSLGSGALVVLAAVGANVHYGAQLIAL
jgi:3-oxoacyl-[acyl-carrier-protein] synthase III